MRKTDEDKSKKKKNRPPKPEKRKPKYGFFSCVWFAVKKIWGCNKRLAILSVAMIPIAVLSTALGLYVPSLMMEQLELSENFGKVAAVILGLLTATGIVSVIRYVMDSMKDLSHEYLLMNFQMEGATHVLGRDYHICWYDENFLDIADRVANSTYAENGVGAAFFGNFANITINVLNFVLFGAVVSMLHPIILVAVIVGCLINFAMSLWLNKRNYTMNDARSKLEKKFLYISYRVGNELTYGKDIRLFSLSGFFDDLVAKLCGEERVLNEKREGYSFTVSLVSHLVNFLRSGLAYVILIYAAFRGEIGASEFVLYFSAVTQLASFISGILNSWSNVQNGALGMSDWRERDEYPNDHNHGKGIELPKGRPLSIEFKNVSYKYPQGDKMILDNVSFKIEAGERIALVGVNGAGKTTMTMLMCGLLIPTEGEVLIDGHSVFEYNIYELYTLFSLIPQDYYLMPFSIGTNVAIANKEDADYDVERINKALEFAGLSEKIASLPLGIDTPLNRQLYPEGIELSGGEAQKLLLARAMYRNASVMILDEPTAALDPISEDRMYQKYNEIENTTSIFISHRLASTRFCDRVFFLDGAHIAEMGTHEDLMAFGGKYKEIFDVQAKYYKEENGNEE